MKAWILEKLGGLGAMRMAEVDDPQAGAGEVVLRVKFAGLNPADKYLTEGQYPARPAFPHIVGRDGLGTVVEVGPGVTGWSVGQTAVVLRSEVGVNRWGTLAEKVAVPAESLVEMPEGWTQEEAGGSALVYLTAYQALTQWPAASEPPMPEGAVVLVTGASGGVGVASVQLARALGWTVIALSRSAEKGKRLRDLGAHAVFNPEDRTWARGVREFLEWGGANRRVDLAIDNIGGALLPEVIETLGMNGRVSVVGRLAGPVPQFNTATLLFRRIRMGGVAVGTYTAAESREAWAKVVGRLAKTGAKPVVDQVFAFEDLMAAFARLGAGPMGKVLVRIAG